MQFVVVGRLGSRAVRNWASKSIGGRDVGVVSEPFAGDTPPRVDAPPRFVWPLAGPFGAVVLGAIAILSLV